MCDDYTPISVVMSVYNGERYLREAIDSILNQTFTDFEFIIIDDGSTDDSTEIITSFSDNRIKLIQQENKGLAAALNKGIKIARGKYTARMDADDISKPDRFDIQFQYMEENPRCVVVGSLSNIISKDGDFLYLDKRPTDKSWLKKTLPNDTPFAHGSSFIRTSALHSVGGYKEQMRFSQDVLLWIDLAELGDFAIIPKPLYNFRITPFSNQRKARKYIKIEKTIGADYFRFKTLNEERLHLLEPIGGGLTVKQKMKNYYLGIGVIYLTKKYDRSLARVNLSTSLKYDIFNFRAYIYFILSFLPYRIIFKLKKIGKVFKVR